MICRNFRAVVVALAIALCCTPAFAQPDDNAPIQPNHIGLDEDGKAAIGGINAFSLELFRQTVEPGANNFISPASVSVTVGLVYRGAAGTTAAELDKVLHFGLPPRDYLRAGAQVIATMSLSGEGHELRTANSIWLQNGTPLRPDYLADIMRYAGTGLHRADFQNAPDAARQQVNDWVAERTRDRIKDLLAPSDVTPATRAILVNAIYWKGTWARPFDKMSTRTEPFTLLSGAKVTAPLMQQRSPYQVAERDGVKAILLPYEGYQVDLAVFLPKSPKGLPRFEAALTTQELARWFDQMETASARDTVLALPKLHLEGHSDLKEKLAEMGAPTAFSGGADFSGMATFPLPDEPSSIGFKISHVIHQTYLDVDEEGTEAAAATAVSMDIVVTSGGGPPPPPPFVFRADKPFLFLLRDRRTGLILFIGRYVTPEAGT